MLQSPCRDCPYQGRTDCRQYCLTLEWAQDAVLKRMDLQSAVDPNGEGYEFSFCD